MVPQNRVFVVNAYILSLTFLYLVKVMSIVIWKSPRH